MRIELNEHKEKVIGKLCLVRVQQTLSRGATDRTILSTLHGRTDKKRSTLAALGT